MNAFTALILALLQGRAEVPRPVELTLEPVTDSALAGIPLVVALNCKNASEREIRNYELVDPYLAMIKWRWEAKGRAPYEPRLTDLHCPIPGISPPAIVALKPREVRTWHATVPTPAEFGEKSKWTLTAAIRMNPSDPEDIATASVEIPTRDQANPRGARTIGATWMQAPMVAITGSEALGILIHEKKFPAVEAASRQGDRAADLVLYCKALSDRQDVLRHRQALGDAPVEIRCLRNYLLFLPLERYRSVLSDTEAEVMKTAISADEPLGRELIRRIENRRR